MENEVEHMKLYHLIDNEQECIDFGTLGRDSKIYNLSTLETLKEKEWRPRVIIRQEPRVWSVGY